MQHKPCRRFRRGGQQRTANDEHQSPDAEARGEGRNSQGYGEDACGVGRTGKAGACGGAFDACQADGGRCVFGARKGGCCACEVRCRSCEAGDAGARTEPGIGQARCARGGRKDSCGPRTDARIETCAGPCGRGAGRQGSEFHTYSDAYARYGAGKEGRASCGQDPEADLPRNQTEDS